MKYYNWSVKKDFNFLTKHSFSDINLKWLIYKKTDRKNAWSFNQLTPSKWKMTLTFYTFVPSSCQERTLNESNLVCLDKEKCVRNTHRTRIVKCQKYLCEFYFYTRNFKKLLVILIFTLNRFNEHSFCVVCAHKQSNFHFKRPWYQYLEITSRF